MLRNITASRLSTKLTLSTFYRICTSSRVERLCGTEIAVFVGWRYSVVFASTAAKTWFLDSKVQSFRLGAGSNY